MSGSFELSPPFRCSQRSPFISRPRRRCEIWISVSYSQEYLRESAEIISILA